MRLRAAYCGPLVVQLERPAPDAHTSTRPAVGSSAPAGLRRHRGRGQHPHRGAGDARSRRHPRRFRRLETTAATHLATYHRSLRRADDLVDRNPYDWMHVAVALEGSDGTATSSTTTPASCRWRCRSSIDDADAHDDALPDHAATRSSSGTATEGSYNTISSSQRPAAARAIARRPASWGTSTTRSTSSRFPFQAEKGDDLLFLEPRGSGEGSAARRSRSRKRLGRRLIIAGKVDAYDQALLRGGHPRSDRRRADRLRRRGRRAAEARAVPHRVLRADAAHLGGALRPGHAGSHGLRHAGYRAAPRQRARADRPRQDRVSSSTPSKRWRTPSRRCRRSIRMRCREHVRSALRAGDHGRASTSACTTRSSNARRCRRASASARRSRNREGERGRMMEKSGGPGAIRRALASLHISDLHVELMDDCVHRARRHRPATNRSA